MIRRFGIGLLLIVALSLAFPALAVHAATLKISPLRYDATLASGEKKKGYVDVTNPSGSATTVKLSVQAFRQIDDEGSLEFYDNDAVSSGVKLDYTEVEIGSRETLHLAFLLDGSRLPEGDVFAAIFAAAEPSVQGAAEQTPKVGTLLILSNGTPAEHTAIAEQLSVPWFQLGSDFSAHFAVKNTSNQSENNGFTPEITVSVWPYISDTVKGPLVFSGRTRQVDYVKSGNFIGVVRASVKTGSSEQAAYTLLITGYWRWILPLILAMIVGVIFVVRKLLRRRQTGTRRGFNKL